MRLRHTDTFSTTSQSCAALSVGSMLGPVACTARLRLDACYSAHRR